MFLNLREKLELEIILYFFFPFIFYIFLKIDEFFKKEKSISKKKVQEVFLKKYFTI